MILITGGTGFLGRTVVELLLAKNEKVRILARRRDAALAARGVEVLAGSVVEPASLVPAFLGITKVIHLAGKVDRSPGAASALYQVHVDGTRNVVRAAARTGVERFVHVSTSGTCAVSDAPDPIRNERSGYAIEAVRAWPYYLSKIYAEKVALEAHAPGVLLDDGKRVSVPVTVVSPSLLLGPGEGALSSSQEVVRFLRGEVPFVPQGGVNFVDVRDAALAVVAALEKGRPGEAYLVGGSNMSVEAFFVLLEKASGVAAPTLALGPGVQRAATRVLAGLESVLDLGGDEATALAMGGKFWYLDAAKARLELGFSPRPPEVTLREAVAFLRAQGPLPPQEGLMGRAKRAVDRALGVQR